MESHLYKITGITNMHVGSGAANYSIVDNEVEKDELLKCPIIHSSGVKGALRDFVETTDNASLANSIFGEPSDKNDGRMKPGAFIFMSANMLTRPLRVSKGTMSFINTTTVDIINNFITLVKSFNCMPEELKGLNPIDLDEKAFGNAEFLCTADAEIEDEETKMIKDEFEQLDLLKKLLGDNFAIAREIDDYPLPIVARNSLDGNGKSNNLWYEEFVPHHSVFYLIILPPKDCNDSLRIEKWLPKDSIIQFGGNSTIGYGYTLVEEWK